MEDTAVEQVQKATEEPTPDAPVEKSLDDILSEYDEAKPEPTPEPKPEEKPDSEVLDYIRSRQAKDTQEDINSAVAVVKKAGVDGISDKLIAARLNLEAQEDKRVQQAWLQRDSNPSGWETVLKGMAKKISGEVSIPDTNSASDREAVRDSVRNVSTEPPEATPITNEKLDEMTGAEFKAYKRKLAS